MIKVQNIRQTLLKRYSKDSLTEWAIKAKGALKDGKKIQYQNWVENITDRMRPKFKRLQVKAYKGQMTSPFDPINHSISQVFKMGFGDWLMKEGGNILIIEQVLKGYNPKLGPFLPYANQTIYFYFLKNFEEYLYKEDLRCNPIQMGDVSKSKYFKRRAFLYEPAVCKKLKKAFDALSPQRRQICTLHYLEFLKTKAIAHELHISQSTVRVSKKKALATLKEKEPVVYDICLRFDKL